MGQAKNRGTLEQRIEAAKQQAEAKGKNLLAVITEDTLSPEQQATSSLLKNLIAKSFVGQPPVKKIAIFNAMMQSLVEHPDVPVQVGLGIVGNSYYSQIPVVQAVFDNLNEENKKEMFGWAL